VQTLVDIQIQGVDRSIPVEIRIGIVVGIPRRRTVGELVQVQIKGVGAAVVIQVSIT